MGNAHAACAILLAEVTKGCSLVTYGPQPCDGVIAQAEVTSCAINMAAALCPFFSIDEGFQRFCVCHGVCMGLPFLLAALPLGGWWISRGCWECWK
jgi:hypothetical protein